MCDRVMGPFWLKMDGKFVMICSESSLKLACEVVTTYHNSICYNIPPDDGFSAETTRMETAARAHMEAPNSDVEEYVTSDEDMEYPTEVYM